MITLVDAMPLGGTIGGAFFAGLLVGYAVKKAIKIAAVVAGMFIAALAYLEYQRILSINWDKILATSQNGITWIANVVMDISNNIGSTHTGAITLSNLGIPLASSASAGFALGMVRG
jgi:uncharacterized membrane protein (Fun14 family)